MRLINTVKPKDRPWMAEYRTLMNDDGFDLATAYVAGVLDGGSSITVRVGKQANARLGYQITPTVSLQRQNPQILYVIDDWARERGISGTFKERTNAQMWTVTRRDDLRTLLETLTPYLVVNENAAKLMLEELLPRLEDGTHRTRDGFIETMEYVDMIHGETSVSQAKYDKSYFEEVWADEIES